MAPCNEFKIGEISMSAAFPTIIFQSAAFHYALESLEISTAASLLREACVLRHGGVAAAEEKIEGISFGNPFLDGLIPLTPLICSAGGACTPLRDTPCFGPAMPKERIMMMPRRWMERAQPALADLGFEG
jgi:hypothetical protein